MRSPYNFIVKPLNGRRYDNIKKIGSTEFITSSSQEDHVVANRFAEVISLPIDYKGPVSEGDTLLVHHNVFKFYYDMKGRQKSGRSFFKDDLFLIDNEQFFLYKNKGTWMAHSKYCFIKPIHTKESYLLKNCVEEPLIGEVKYINQELLDLGVSVGDQISFVPDSDYPFTVDDEKLYRMFTDNITMIL
tara:strand:+ start:3675 stop:4238 length:564 start_codon:yes stop_codon:yes gene_type:complete